VKRNLIDIILIISCLIFVLGGCKKNIFTPESQEFNVNSFISKIKCFNENAEYIKNTFPADTSSIFRPYVSVQSWVIKGKDILLSVLVPVGTEEIYFAAINPKDDYFGIHLEGENQNTTNGYYNLKVGNIKSFVSDSADLLNYYIVLSSNESINLNSFNLIVTYKTTNGISNQCTSKIDVKEIAPYQKNLKLGFSPLNGYTYTIDIVNPSGNHIIYSYNKYTGSETFDNSQSPKSTLSNDQTLNLKWIDLDPLFGNYSLTATIQIENTGSSQYILLLLAIITEGKIDQISLDAEIQQSGSNYIGIGRLGFHYFDELTTKVKMKVYKYQYLQNQPPFSQEAVVPDDKKTDPGVGIRYNGSTNKDNLIKVVLEVNPEKPPVGVKFYLRRSNSNIDVWGTSNWTELILFLTDQAEISFNGPTKEIFIENTKIGSSTLEVIAMDDNQIISSDMVTFHTYKSLVISFAGEFVFQQPNPGQGIWNLADDLFLNEGYDVYKYIENDCHDLTTPSASYDMIVAAINKRNIENIAILGYSHGGGSTYLLAKRLMDNNINVNVSFTAYIDAVEQPFADWWAESRIPCRSKVHMNWFHRNQNPSLPFLCINPFCGNLWDGNTCGYSNPLVIEKDVMQTVWGKDLDHGTIHTNPNVLNSIKMYLKTWMKPW